MKAHTAVLLVNLGTPDSPSVPDVRKYLREFLLDPRVIDISAVARFLLVNLIIAPFRAPKSAKAYRSIWSKETGSPLMHYSKRQQALLQERMGPEYHVVLAMRYQNPSIASVVESLKNKGFDKIIVLPLFPQYASASTGTAAEEVMRQLVKWQAVPSVSFIQRFADHPAFIHAFAEVAKPYLEKGTYDHYVFSYHGLPQRQILKASCGSYCQMSDKCCGRYTSQNLYCYRAQCYETTRLIAAKLGIAEDQYTVCFQSRLGRDPWVKPYTDDKIKELAAAGKKRILALVPSFVADCLETIEEVAEEYKEMFLHEGGETWTMVPSLNEHPAWIAAMETIIKENEGIKV